MAWNNRTQLTYEERIQFGDRLKEATKKAGLTQYQLADAAGIPRGTINGYATGNLIPPAERLQSMAKVLGVSAEYLIKGDG